eukprot:m.1443702 g.1443702  ORF g.1443702 m.1443702 type:complete len:110 (-) comp25103_c0_seq8:15-344(-)
MLVTYRQSCYPGVGSCASFAHTIPRRCLCWMQDGFSEHAPCPHAISASASNPPPPASCVNIKYASSTANALLEEHLEWEILRLADVSITEYEEGVFVVTRFFAPRSPTL